MEQVQRISNCAEEDKTTYATCTLEGRALTWWNAQAQIIGVDDAYRLSWAELKKRMNEEYCPRNELQKLDAEFWNHKMIGSDIASYNDRFHDLANLCPHMVTPDYKRIDMYIAGLPEQIQSAVTSARVSTIQEAMKLANTLRDQAVKQGKFKTVNQESSGSHKRKWENFPNKFNTPSKQQDHGKKGTYVGTLPMCNKCNYHHTGACGSVR